MSDDLTAEELDTGLAALSGGPASRAGRTRADTSATPWRAEAPEAFRGMLAEAEEELAQLWSTRRGNTMEASRLAVERIFREAWAYGGRTTSLRYGAVLDAMHRESQRLAALPPIAVPSAIAPTAPAGAADISTEALDEGLAKLTGRTIKEG